MPYRLLAANALGEFLSAIAHPRRIQIIEELRSGERDVGSLTTTLGVSHSNVSQHLAVLRAHRVVAERVRAGGYFTDFGQTSLRTGWLGEWTFWPPWISRRAMFGRRSKRRNQNGLIDLRSMSQ